MSASRKYATPEAPTQISAESLLSTALAEFAVQVNRWHHSYSQSSARRLARICMDVRPALITLAANTREGLDNLESVDALSRSPTRNASVLIATFWKILEESNRSQGACPPAPQGGQNRRPNPEERPNAIAPEAKPSRKRGRPGIPRELKEKALRAPNGKEKAMILYGTKRPSPQQVKSSWGVLKYFKANHQVTT